MNQEEQSRFITNAKWFNQFFGGIRQLYGLVVETLPPGFFPEDFALTSRNFYFPRQNSAPTIPPYYLLMVGGKQFALQVLAIFDPDRFGKSGLFTAEPSIVVVLHSRAERYGYIEDYALRVIGNRGTEIERQADGKVWGKINAKLPADFFSFQVSFDEFSVNKNTRDAVSEHIVDPIIEYIEEK